MMNLDALIDRDGAALLVGVSPRTIESWVDRGRLVRSDTGPRGKALYRVRDVLAAERATRENSCRQVQRNQGGLA